jgi:hypothetical protein
MLPGELAENIEAEIKEAEEKAWQSLAHYKFQMFGYWAAIWVHLNRLDGGKRPNPWSALVKAAEKRDTAEAQKLCDHVFRNWEMRQTAGQRHYTFSGNCHRCGLNVDAMLVDGKVSPEQVPK